MPVAYSLTAADAYHELCAYTLAHGDPSFIHQHVVDAFAAQSADERTKPITLTFALVGLHLHVDKGYSGRQVQKAHQQLAATMRAWPSIALPFNRGGITAPDVIAATEGPDRDRAINEWCASVWSSYRDTHATIAALLREHGIG